MAEFWKINDSRNLGVFRPMMEHAEKMAKKYGALIIDGTTHFSSIERYRKPNDSWHDASQEYEFSLLWEVFFQDLMQLAQFMPDHLYNFC